MKKYGEIDRFKIRDLLYILRTFKCTDHKFQELYIPGFDLSISRKTAKKHRSNYSKNIKYSLLNEGFQSFQTMKRIERGFKEYLDFYKPSYISISAFKDSYNLFYKRIQFYEKRLNKMSYYYQDVDNDYDDPVYYFKLIENKV